MFRLKLPGALAGLLGLSQPAEPPPRPPAAPVEDACRATSPPTLELEIPFAYAEAGLSETAYVRLSELGIWLWCHPGARVTLAVQVEHHYRRPEIERDLIAARRQTVAAYLRDRGVEGDRLAVVEAGSMAEPGSAHLLLKGRGW